MQQRAHLIAIPPGVPLRLVTLGLVLLMVSGCENASAPGFLQASDKPVATGSQPGQSTKLVERDIEAPEVFQVSEAGLWDGRPSLGGVWVAHPDVKDPQRVIIRNSANGKFVIGALFRRERDIPGPRIQASSDAAAALGMLAGAPSKLNVTALIREAAPDDVAEEEVKPEIVAATPVEEKPEAKTTRQAAVETAPETLAEAEAETEAEARPRTGLRALFRKRDKLATPDIDQTTLDPIAGAAAAIDAAEPTATATIAPARVATAATPTARAPAAAPKPPKPRKASSLNKPYIQIGIFSVKANADRTANQMRNAGMVPTVYDQTSNGKRFWRVVIGPSQNTSERATLLKKVKAAGYSDAYFVTN